MDSIILVITDDVRDEKDTNFEKRLRNRTVSSKYRYLTARYTKSTSADGASLLNQSNLWQFE